MLCPECGAQVAKEFSHCPWCGHTCAHVPEAPSSASQRPGLSEEEDAFVGPLFRFPPLTAGILLLNIVIYLLMEQNGGSNNPFTLLIFGAKLPAPIFKGDWWRLLTANFLHIGLLHLVLNSLTLVQLGLVCENLYGKLRFFNLYLLSGIGGFLASTLYLDSLSAGASASLFGLMGATLTFGWRHYYEIPKTFRPHFTWYLLPWVVAMLLFGLVFGQIDNLAHAGGLLTGSLIALVLRNQVLPSTASFRPWAPLLVSLPLLAFSVHSVYEARQQVLANLEIARAIPGEQDPAGQVEVLSRFIDADDTSGLYFFLRARANYLAGRLEAAEADYRDAIIRRHEISASENELAWTLLSLPSPSSAQLEEAVLLSRRAVAADRNPAYLNTLGYALFQKGELTSAERELLAAIQEGGESPARAVDYFILATLYHQQAKPEQAQAALKKAEAYRAQLPAPDAELERIRDRSLELMSRPSPP